MTIDKIEFIRLDLKMKSGYTIAYESIDHADNVILKITTTDGLTGWGCAAPDETITHESAEDVIANIEHLIIPQLKGQDPFQMVRFHEELKAKNPLMRSTLAMVNMALYDLMARRARLPLYQLLGGYRKKIQTSITIGIETMDETLRLAREFWQEGFRILKLKGGLNVEEDIEKVFRLRERLGPELTLRFDANQGYSIAQSVQFVEQTKEAKIEILEQPTPYGEDEAMRKVVNSVEIPVMADESIRSLNDVFRLSKNDSSDMINIKIMKVGGLTEAQHINSVAKAAGMEVMVGCLDECALGIAAGLHFALSRPNVEYADLDGHLDFTNDPFASLFTIQDGWIAPTEEIGLGKINL
ncbi:MAG: dipeptide epimerase [bacterium]|nr:dipeptide epimerase [bacterium]